MVTAAVLATSFAGLQLPSVTASAESVHIWDGTADTSWYTGDKDTYEIYTAEQLAGLSKLVNEVADENRFMGITINLMNDICLNDTSNHKNWLKEPPKNKWDPMGRNGNWTSGNYDAFAGVFNGNGHTISGMYVYETRDDCGLFGYISTAVICNLKMEKCFTMMDYPYLAGSAGTLVGLCESSSIDNVEISDCAVYGSVFTGGLIGDIGGTRELMGLGTSLIMAVMTGILVNPILFQDVKLGNSAITNCKISNTSIKTYLREDNIMVHTCCAPITACSRSGTVFYNCISENCVVGYEGYRTYHLRYGPILANGGDHSVAATNTAAGDRYTIKNCYAYNLKYVGKPENSWHGIKHVFVDAASVVGVNEYHSAEFVEKLGDSYTSAPNGAPILKSLKNSDQNYRVYPGDLDNNGTFDFDDVSVAITYFLNGTKIDKRTAEAMGITGRDTMDFDDVQTLISWFLVEA